MIRTSMREGASPRPAVKLTFRLLAVKGACWLMPRQRRRATAAYGVAVHDCLTNRPFFVLDLFVVQVVRHIVRSDAHARRMGEVWI